MAVFKVEHNSNYTVMSNVHFKEKKMSLKAKGLLSLMLSLPEDWDYSIAGLVAICKENETAIKSTLKELSEFGYLRIDKIYPDKTDTGRIEYVYNVFEIPRQAHKKQELENLPLEIQCVENQVQLNTKELNTKNKIKNIDKCVKPKISKKDKILKMVEKKCLEFDIEEDVIDKLFEFYNVLIENNKLVSEQKVNADLSNLAKVNYNKQLQTINEALNRGWTTLNPEWLDNIGTRKQNKNTLIHHEQKIAKNKGGIIV